MEVWDRIDVAVIELWRIPKPEFDRAEFYRQINAFPNKSIRCGKQSTMADIMDFLCGDEGRFEDLYLWR